MKLRYNKEECLKLYREELKQLLKEYYGIDKNNFEELYKLKQTSLYKNTKFVKLLNNINCSGLNFTKVLLEIYPSLKDKLYLMAFISSGYFTESEDNIRQYLRTWYDAETRKTGTPPTSFLKCPHLYILRKSLETFRIYWEQTNLVRFINEKSDYQTADQPPALRIPQGFYKNTPSKEEIQDNVDFLYEICRFNLRMPNGTMKAPCITYYYSAVLARAVSENNIEQFELRRFIRENMFLATGAKTLYERKYALIWRDLKYYQTVHKAGNSTPVGILTSESDLTKLSQIYQSQNKSN